MALKLDTAQNNQFHLGSRGGLLFCSKIRDTVHIENTSINQQLQTTQQNSLSYSQISCTTD